MKYVFIVFLAVILIFGALFATSYFLGQKDSAWVCRGGEWERVGEPKGLPPDSGCEEAIDCVAYEAINCPEECVVCPPCPECSSISCQSEEFCLAMGIDRDWYDNIQSQVENFAQCVAAGNPVMESYPRQCRVGDQLFVEDIGDSLDKADLIQLDSPRPGDRVSSPLTVSGQARGYWFFEASFPVQITDSAGNVIAETFAQAQDEWMTEDFVPFSSVIEFNKPAGQSQGYLVLRKDNPSALPEFDDEMRIPVLFE